MQPFTLDLLNTFDSSIRIRLCIQILRVIDSLQLTAKHSVATPVNWKHGEDVVVVPTLSDDQAREKARLIP